MLPWLVFLLASSSRNSSAVGFVGATDGGPSGGYWSGLIAIPPGYLNEMQKR